MKNHLLTPIFADLLKSAKGYAKRAAQITPAGNRFRTFSLKPVLLKTALVVFSLFMANAAFANIQVNSITVASPQTAVYGTTSLNVTVNLNRSGNGFGNNQRITITAAGGGITLNPNPTNYQVAGGAGGATTTITLTIPAGLAVGTYAVTINNQDRSTFTNSPATFNVNITQRPLNVTATAVTVFYGSTPAVTLTYNTVNGNTPAQIFTTIPTPPTASNLNAGTFALPVASGGVLNGGLGANYSLNYMVGSYTISPHSLTTTANNVTKVVGTALTNGATGYTNYTALVGLQNGETVSSVTVNYVNPRGDRAADPVGSYNGSITLSTPVGPGTFSASNYTFTATPGNINVIAATYDWTGAAGSTFWNVAGNWNLNGVPSTTLYPGMSSASDIARIGVSATTFTFQPEITANIPNSIATLTFGSTSAPILTVDAPATTGITVTGTLTINANTTVGIVANGPVSVTGNYADASTSTWNVSGNSSFSINLGNRDVNVAGMINQLSTGTGSIKLTSNSNNDININATGSVNQAAAATGTVTLLSDGNTNISGTLSQSGTGAFKATSNGDFTVNASGSVNQAATATGSMTLLSNGTMDINGTLTQSSASTFTATASGNPFFDDLTIGGTGVVTQNSLIAGGTLSLITTNGLTLQNNGHITLQNAGKVTMTASGYIANGGTILQSGSGTMTLNGGGVGITGFFNNNTMTQSGSGAMIFNGAFHNNVFGGPIPTFTQSGTGSVTFNNTFDNGYPGVGNGGSIKFGDAPSTVTFNNNFTINNGSVTVTFGTGLATFSGPTTATSIITIPKASTLTLVNTLFMNNVTHAFNTNAGGAGAAAAYIIAANGVMTLNSSNTICDFTNALSLTLNSDVTGSASIAALTSTTQIAGLAGKAIVKRFIQGSADQSKRGYRLITSTVYTGTVAGTNVFDFTYLKTNNLSGFGLAANGFNMTTTTNPTIYLFREDDPPPPALTTIFTTGYNWKGVAKINNAPAYNIGTQTRAQQTNVLDTTVTIPVTNGILYFFRGGGLVNNYTAPFAAPADATLSETGTLNMGTIPVKLWYAGSVAGLGSNLSYSVDALHTSAPAGSLTSGFNLVGNPYPSTINWEKYGHGGMTGSLDPTNIYVFNALNKQYEAYQIVNNGDLTSEFTSSDGLGNAIGSASNFIASGQAFFVQATGPGQNFTFNEAAKISAQPTQANFNKLMSKSAPLVAAPVPFLQLRMVKDSLNFDEAIIRFKENSSANYVRGEDAVDMGGSDAPESFSVFSADSIKLAINAMPLPGLKPSVVHLFTGSPTTGPYSLNVKALKNLPALYNVWLKDGFTKDSVDLRKTATYAFTIDKTNPATFGANRFTVVFSQDTANAYHLLNFDAQKVASEQKVQTTWKTKNEQNYTNFTVERSKDNGQTFDVVGGMPGTGAGLYSLVDKNPSKGNNVYRLKQEDINNVITYSNLVEVFFGNKNDRIHLYPNPAVNVINVDVRERWHDRDRYEIIVTNSAGTIVKRGTSGDSQWQAGISNLRPGTYLVSVLSKDDKNLVGQAKFVKL